MEKLKKIGFLVFGVICCALALALLSAAIFVGIFGRSGKELFIGGYGVVWVKTDSMNPTIPQKSYILIKKAAAEDVKEGDVIVFVSDDPSIEGQKNVHRVVRVFKDEAGRLFFNTRGDNPETNPKDDDYPASGEKLIGRHVTTLGFLSMMGRLLSEPNGLAVVLVAVFLIVGAMFLPQISILEKKTEEVRRAKKERLDELVRLEVERLKASGGLPEEAGSCEKNGTDGDPEA